MPSKTFEFNKYRLESDPIADQVIENIMSTSNVEGINNLFLQLRDSGDISKIDFPDCVKSYFETTSVLPDWYDADKIKIGQQVFAKHGPQISLNLLCKSLPEAYACANGAKVLYTTGRMTERNGSLDAFTKRLMETSQFVVNVCIPGGLSPNGKGIITAQKVRLIHAAIRFYLKKHNWSTSQFGEPINQQDMAGTLQSFSTLVLEGLETMKIDLTEEEKDGYYHCWRIIGHIMGVDEKLNPPTHTEGLALGRAILKDQIAPSMEGEALTKAVCDFMANMLPEHLFKDVPEILIKYLVGDNIAQKIGITQNEKLKDKIFLKLMDISFETVDDIGDSNKLLSKIIEKTNMYLLQGMLNHFNKGNDVKFFIPPSLKKDWNLN